MGIVQSTINAVLGTVAKGAVAVKGLNELSAAKGPKTQSPEQVAQKTVKKGKTQENIINLEQKLEANESQLKQAQTGLKEAQAGYDRIDGVKVNISRANGGKYQNELISRYEKSISVIEQRGNAIRTQLTGTRAVLQALIDQEKGGNK